MKKFVLELELEDNFEPGDCTDCPLHYWREWDDDGYTEMEIACGAHDSSFDCPLKEVEK